MFKVLLAATLVLASFIGTNGECANGCSGHGRCTSYDMCVCNRNWMANDCSERVCQFGLAHVDTPKGDLDMNGVVTDGTKVVAENSFVYPYGTTEAFPFCRDTELNDIPHSAHYYQECSNKGTCDRTTGTCACFDGYDGAACQRASCPGFPESCSGHGVCRSIEQLANDDYGNIYKLWDRKSTMGCQCDKSYFGPDCSQRECKHGVDPLYLDDSATLRIATYDVAVLTTSATIDFTDGTPLHGQAYWALRFYDIHGEDWLTRPIRAGASCDEVLAALEALPNNVIPAGQTWCTLTEAVNQNGVEGWVNGTDTHYPTGSDDSVASNVVWSPNILPGSRLIKYPLAFWEQNIRSSYRGSFDDLNFAGFRDDVLSGYIYRLKFIGNPGDLKQPEVEVYLDGKRPSINSKNGKVITKVWTDGQQGENDDFLADHCDGVTVQIGYTGTTVKGPYFFLTGFTAVEKALLKTCLGDADFDTSNNVEVYNWDYGTREYPHLIKLVKSRTTLTDGGYLAVIYLDNTVNQISDNLGDFSVFRLMNPFFSADDYAFGKQFQRGDLDQPSQLFAYTGKDQFEVYTTKGVLALTSNKSEATFGFASQEIFMTNVSYDMYQGYNGNQNQFDGDISCEIGANNGFKSQYVKHCLNKSDNFILLNWDTPHSNPQHLNLYTAEKISTKKYFASEAENFWGTKFQGFPYLNHGTPAGPNAVAPFASGGLNNRGSVGGTQDSHFETHSIITDIATNWAQVVSDKPVFQVYKFFPSADSTYGYVSECSNRGICDETTGVCNCFPGYSHDDCSQQNSLHV